MDRYSWELGAGLASLSFPAYRGSDVRETLVLPVPSISISSPRFRLNRQGARLSLLETPWLRVRLSASGSLPVDSDDVPLRAGMPDLDPSFELGPAAIIELPCTAPFVCQQQTLLRGVIASDFRSLTSIGWTLQPRLSLKYSQGSQNLRLTLGPVVASRRYHDYFYSVAAQFETSARPRYAASGGFSGWRSSASYNYQKGRFGASVYMAYDALADASFADSPLLETTDYLLGGLYLRWTFFSSKNPLPNESLDAD